MYRRKPFFIFLSALLVLGLLTGCTAAPATGGSSSSGNSSTGGNAAVVIPSDIYDSDDLNADWNESGAILITLNGNTATASASSVTVSGSTVKITAGGTYLLRGTLDDGQLLVEAPDSALVRLILDGVTLSSSTTAPIYISQAKKTVITLAEGSVNTLTDGVTYPAYTEENDEPNSALFAKDDLTINGSGSLTVNARFNNGITSRDELKIVSGSINVIADDDGLMGRDTLAICGGDITITAKGDGMKSSNTDADKGNILIQGGTFTITAGNDGIQAVNTLTITGGDWNVTATGKGIKSEVALNISGGTLNINATDDSVHSNGNVTISGGDLTIATQDDGVHAEGVLSISGGNVLITASVEGLEGATVDISGGTIHLTARDDGVNAASANRSGNLITISGGLLVVDAGGDGLDANGSINITGGTVLVNGPVNSGNGAIDADMDIIVNGGLLIAVGSAQMAQGPSQSSTQYCIISNLDTVQQAGTPVTLTDGNGTALLTFIPTKNYQSVVLSTPLLTNGSSYKLVVGGTVTGTGVDGLYEGNYCTGGADAYTFTVSSIVTTLGNVMGGFGGGGMGGQGGQRPTDGTIPDRGTMPEGAVPGERGARPEGGTPPASSAA